jgi:SAM-dependent methyltransferase
MSPEVFDAFARIARRYWCRPPRAVLEVGASAWTLLEAATYRDSRRIALNLTLPKRKGPLARCSCIVANGNQLPFADDSLDGVLSSSVLEHDKFFWRSVAEVRRVLRPGGLFIVGVPIYMALPTDFLNTTLTFRRHGLAYNADFYRFSDQAVREVLLEALLPVEVILVRRYPNPYLVAAASKEAR